MRRRARRLWAIFGPCSRRPGCRDQASKKAKALTSTLARPGTSAGQPGSRKAECIAPQAADAEKSKPRNTITSSGAMSEKQYHSVRRVKRAQRKLAFVGIAALRLLDEVRRPDVGRRKRALGAHRQRVVVRRIGNRPPDVHGDDAAIAARFRRTIERQLDQPRRVGKPLVPALLLVPAFLEQPPRRGGRVVAVHSQQRLLDGLRPGQAQNGSVGNHFAGAERTANQLLQQDEIGAVAHGRVPQIHVGQALADELETLAVDRRRRDRSRIAHGDDLRLEQHTGAGRIARMIERFPGLVGKIVHLSIDGRGDPSARWLRLLHRFPTPCFRDWPRTDITAVSTRLELRCMRCASRWTCRA